MMFQILSLSGGGFLGLYTATILAKLEQRSNSPIATHFELLAGTSIGGIVALALAAEVPAIKIKKELEGNGKRIFGDRSASRSWLAAGREFAQRFSKSKYDAGALRSTIEEIVGEDTRIGDLRHPVIVPAVNLSRGAPQLFKTPHHPTFQVDLDLRVADVAMATSAAPTYFPLAVIGDSLYADGGLFANSPDMLGLHEAMHFFEQPEHQIRILSIGTTTAKFSFAQTNKRRFGVWQWLRGARLMNVTIASQQRSVDFMLGHRLGERYLRLDEYQSKEQEQALGLDIANDEAQQTIRSLAEGTFQYAVNDARLIQLLEHSARAPKFFNRVNQS